MNYLKHLKRLKFHPSIWISYILFELFKLCWFKLTWIWQKNYEIAQEKIHSKYNIEMNDIWKSNNLLIQIDAIWLGFYGVLNVNLINEHFVDIQIFVLQFLIYFRKVIRNGMTEVWKRYFASHLIAHKLWAFL